MLYRTLPAYWYLTHTYHYLMLYSTYQLAVPIIFLTLSSALQWYLTIPDLTYCSAVPTSLLVADPYSDLTYSHAIPTSCRYLILTCPYSTCILVPLHDPSLTLPTAPGYHRTG